MWLNELQHILEQQIQSCDPKKLSVALFYFSVDDINEINVSYGFECGNSLLKEVLERCRKISTPETTHVRCGGNRFAVAMFIDDVAQAKAFADKLHAAFTKEFIFKHRHYHISISTGIALYPNDSANSESLISHADLAMYHARHLGKNHYQFYVEGTKEAVEKNRILINQLHKTIGTNQFRLFFQPQYDVQTRKIIGAEALIRWKHPKFGMIPAAEFIPLAEDSGLITAIGDWALEKVCSYIQYWQVENINPPPIAINRSAKQFYQRDLLSATKKQLKKYDVPPTLIEFEITENTTIRNPEAVIKTIQALKEIGINVVIDDFGTGLLGDNYPDRLTTIILAG